MKKICLPTGKRRQVLTFALLVLLTIAILAVSLLLPIAMHRNNLYVDLTPEGLYTVTDLLKEELSTLEEDVEIIFCADEDYLFGNDETRYPFVMCKKLAEDNEHISIRYINVVADPSSANPYKTTEAAEIAWSDVIVSAGGRFKVLSAPAFYSSSDGEYVAYNGEYRIATAILSLTAYKDGPLALFTYGHGERYYVKGDEGSDPSLSAFHEMLLDLGLRVGKIDITAVDAVPEDCVLLVMCGPTEDYDEGDIYEYSTVSSLEKIDRYLANHHSLMVFRDALAPEMPALNEYLDEWGFSIGTEHVTSLKSSLTVTAPGEKEGNRLVAVYPDKDSAAIGHSLFSAIADMATPPETVLANAAPVTMTWRENLLTTANDTTRCVSAVFYAGADAQAHDASGYLSDDNKDGGLWLGAISSEAHLLPNGEHDYAYVFGAGSTALISNEYLADPALGNGDVMFSTLRTISRADVYASSALGGFDMNSEVDGVKTYGGKMYEETHLTAGEKNTVHFNLSESKDYSGISTASVVWACLLTIAVPTLAVGCTAFGVLRRRKHR